jgi:helix-turn-helix, Psq domain
MPAQKKIERVAPHSRGTGAMSITRFASEYGVSCTTVWRALRDGRLEFVTVGKRKLVLPPRVQRNEPREETATV